MDGMPLHKHLFILIDQIKNMDISIDNNSRSLKSKFICFHTKKKLKSIVQLHSRVNNKDFNNNQKYLKTCSRYNGTIAMHKIILTIIALFKIINNLQ